MPSVWAKRIKRTLCLVELSIGHVGLESEEIGTLHNSSALPLVEPGAHVSPKELSHNISRRATGSGELGLLQAEVAGRSIEFDRREPLEVMIGRLSPRQLDIALRKQPGVACAHW